jgi:hypothetical protein
MKTFLVHTWMEQQSWITGTKEKNYYPLPYYNMVKENFIESQMNCGLGEDEALDIFNENPFSKIEKFLIKSGYDLGGQNHE